MSAREAQADSDLHLGDEATEAEIHSFNDERADADYQRTWTEVMEKGPYKNPSSYKKCAVLLLCWEGNSDDLETKDEVDRLKLIFEEKFRYTVQVKHIDNHSLKRLQVHVNAKVAQFVDDFDGPHTLLIVYYAGHGKPGKALGDLNMFGKSSPNDLVKRSDSLVWNQVENSFRPAEAHVLEILDCCYAGTLTLTRGEQKKFELLAACSATGTTPRSGPESFTTALIHALEKLLTEKHWFNTVELLNEIRQAPSFPENQVPVLSERGRDPFGHIGRIMMHPLALSEEGSYSRISPVEASPPVLVEQPIEPTVTLHFDFARKPSPQQIKILGEELNKVFEDHAITLGVSGIRWGGMNLLLAKNVLRHWKEHVRAKRASLKLEQHEHPSPHALGILTPPTVTIGSPKKRHFVLEGTYNPADQSLAATLDSEPVSVEPSDHEQGHHQKRKLSGSLEVPGVD